MTIALIYKRRNGTWNNLVALCCGIGPHISSSLQLEFFTLYNGVVLKYKFMDGTETRMKDIEAYAKTMPWHPVYNIIVFPVFAWLYLSGLPSITFGNVMATSLIWGTITVVFDLVGWVLIKHPWSCTFKDFYVDYQPWITFIYLAIYASPMIAWGVIHFLA